MIWWLGYVALLLILFVRVRTPDSVPPPPVFAEPDEPLRLVHAHHGLFYTILFGTPVEALLRGGAAHGRLVGLALFAVGVALYRMGGRALGDSLSPLVNPRVGAMLVTHGLYRHVRHPMYLGQACIALGAPLTLGSRRVVWLALPAVALLVARALVEDGALARTYPAHAGWAARTKRLVPFVF
jgi:protein-S-isoprenylcysteine O-methyltransferase Ste14